MAGHGADWFSPAAAGRHSTLSAQDLPSCSSLKKKTKKELLQLLLEEQRQRVEEQRVKDEQEEAAEMGQQQFQQAAEMEKDLTWETHEQLIKCAPHKCTLEIFKANNPFVSVHKQDVKQKRVDKFSIEMDRDALDACMQEFEKPVIDAYLTAAGDLFTEQGGHELHASLFRGLGRITRPSPTCLIDLKQSQKALGLDFVLNPNVDDNNPSGFAVAKPHAEQDIQGWFQESDKSENEGYLLGQSERSDVGGGNKGSGFMDFCVKVQDYRPKDREKLVEVQVFDPTKYVLTIERKWARDESSENGIYQGGMYSLQGVRSNLLSGHKSPIYTVVLCSREWTYAKLEVRGLIQIQDGKVVKEAYPAYSKLEKKIGYTVDEALSLEAIEQRLTQATKRVKAMNLKQGELKYPDGSYIVGEYFVAPKYYDLPTPKLFYTADTTKFYEGLIRIVAGDSVLKWSKKDVVRLKKLNKDIIREYRRTMRTNVVGRKRKLDDLCK